jgi:hypothetical protein
MKRKINRTIPTLIFSFLALVIIMAAGFINNKPGSALAASIDTPCRFGITSPSGSEGYAIDSLGVGSYLDWTAGSDPVLPPDVEYIQVLRLRDDLYAHDRENLPAWLARRPGSVWVIGNEPDTTYGGQDELLAEVYADRYYELARIIRKLDPSAKLAFGSIVQPTPLRMRYLARAWDRLVSDAGGVRNASLLIDIWSIHSFILNEDPGKWGTGIPLGFEGDYSDAVIITDFSDTYNIEIFKQRIIAFRSWMAEKGERDKPLWITEYGSLFPPIDPPGGPDYYNISDEDTTSFMLDTFIFMLGAEDDQAGMPADSNHLVQRWFWYSLNEHRYVFGGSLFDPDNAKLPTWVGNHFINFQAGNLMPVDLLPLALSIAPISYNSDHTRVNYRLDISIGNKLFSDASCAQVWLYDGDPNAGGVLIAGPIQASAIQSDFGKGKLSYNWMNVEPFTEHMLYVYVGPVHVEDNNPGNNLASFKVFTDIPHLALLPIINH